MKSFFYIAVLFILSGCAQMFPPSGGEKDVTPPQIVEEKTTPRNRSVNFNSKTIVLVFDEYIKLNNPNEQIIISPAMEEKPDFVLKGKKLFIELNSELKPNTTYTINFGNCISDITENNPAAGMTYVFSTGAFIDSLRLSGTVTNAFTNAPEKNVWVLLHKNLSDTSFQKNFPDYLAKTDANGNYSLQNLSAGEYNIYSLKDGNSDYKYSQPSEEIAFYDDPISIGEKNEVVNLKLFKEDNEKQFVKSSSYRWPGVITIVMNRADTSFRCLEFPKYKSEGGGGGGVIWSSYIEIKDSAYFYHYYSENRDTLKIWQYPNLKKPITTLHLNGNNYSDTLDFDIENLNSGNLKSFKIKTNAHNDFDSKSLLTFAHEIPFTVYDSLINFFENDTINIPDSGRRFMTDDSRHKSYKINLKEKMDYKIILQEGAFIDMYGQKSKADTIKFSTAKKDFYGNIIPFISIPEGDYVVQLLGAGDKIISESNLNRTIVKDEFNTTDNTIGNLGFQNLKPGTYKMRIFQDTNLNGKWDTGNLTEKKQPEKIYYYKEPIVIRSNWDFELTWKIEN